MERDKNVIIKDNNNSYRNVFTEPRRMFLLTIFLESARLFNLFCGIPGDPIFLREENLIKAHGTRRVSTPKSSPCERNSLNGDLMTTLQCAMFSKVLKLETFIFTQSRLI